MTLKTNGYLFDRCNCWFKYWWARWDTRLLTKTFLREYNLWLVPPKQDTSWRKKTEMQCKKQPQSAAPAISPVTHECSISAKLHYVAGTTGVEVSHPALTCVLQLYERASASATNFPMQGKTGILIAFSRVREKLFLNNKFMAARNYSLQYGFLLHRICVDSY